jgi:hypothetical protein
MKKLIRQLLVHFSLSLMIVLTAVQPLYCQQGVKLSAWFTAQDVNSLLSNISGSDSAVDWCKGRGVTKIYLEAYGRGDYADRKSLMDAKTRFLKEGLAVGSGVTTKGFGKDGFGNGWNGAECYTNSKTQQELQRIFEYAASIGLPVGSYNKLYLLAAATHDTTGELSIGKQKIHVGFQAWTGYIGQHYGRKLTNHDTKVTEITPAFLKGDNIAWYASHCHSPKGNAAYQYSYLYKYAFNIPNGAKSITLSRNEAIKIFAMTVANDPYEDIAPLQPLYDNFKDNGTVQLR